MSFLTPPPVQASSQLSSTKRSLGATISLAPESIKIETMSYSSSWVLKQMLGPSRWASPLRALVRHRPAVKVLLPFWLLSLHLFVNRF